MANKNIFYDVVIFHGPKCPDGMTSAWIYWLLLPEEIKEDLRKFGGIYGKIDNLELKMNSKFYNTQKGVMVNSKNLKILKSPLVNFIYVQPGEQIDLEIISNKKVLILDLDMGDELINIIKNSDYTFIIDHHFTSNNTIEKIKKEKIPKRKYSFYFNDSKSESGASLTWKYFIDEEVPWFINVVRIGDTYSFEEYEEAKYILTYLNTKGIFLSFYNLDNFIANIGKKYVIEKIIKKGKIMNKQEQIIAFNSARNFTLSRLMTNDGKKYLVAYCSGNTLSNDMSLYIRDLAQERTIEKIDFVATWKYIPFKKLVLVSLRDPYNCNLGEIASNIIDIEGNFSNGGGGHEKAASFKFEGLENFHKFLPIVF